MRKHEVKVYNFYWSKASSFVKNVNFANGVDLACEAGSRRIVTAREANSRHGFNSACGADFKGRANSAHVTGTGFRRETNSGRTQR